jgi:hypothetical protein
MNQPLLSIERARLRYRMDRASTAHRPRLDRAFSRVLERLELALRERGVDPERPLCIRRLESHVRLRLQDADGPLTEAWLSQLAGSLSEAITGGSADVIRYRSRRHALSELVLAAADGDTRHAWAWAQLGLWSRGETADAAVACEEALRALASDPPAVVPVLAHAAREGRLERLLMLGRDASWSAVARAALQAAGMRALPSAPRVLDAAWESASANGPSEPAAALLDTRARAFERWVVLLARSGVAARVQRSSAPLSRVKLEACAIVAGLEAEPLGLPPLGPGWFDAASEALLGPVAASAAQRAIAARDPVLQASAVARSLATDPPEEASTSVEPTPAVTRAGGLLFLLHLARDLDLPKLIAEDPVLAGRGLREVLVRLAARWAAIEMRDPAALAFAGLAPQARLDFELGPWLAAEPAFDRLRSSFTEALAARVPMGQGSGEALLRWVVERRAVIVADPGWIEAQFSLADVSVALRRSGLDLHPNFLPWLGVVLRFSYV